MGMQCQRAVLCDSQWCGWHEFYAVCGRAVIFLHGAVIGRVARRAVTAFPRGAWERVNSGYLELKKANKK